MDRGGFTRPHHKQLAGGPFLLNVFIGIIFVGLLLYVPRHYLQPQHQGFYCDDRTIQLPYYEEIIPGYALLLALFILPAIIIFLTEMYRSRCIIELYSWKGYNVGQVFTNSLRYFSYNLLALLISLTLVQVAKYGTGRLRPHFIAICQPDISLDKCKGDNTYKSVYKCQNAAIDNDRLRSARMSFFSGHAALSFTAATFLVIYLHARIPRKYSLVVLRSMLQTILLCIAFYVGWTRILDNSHHISDVVTGYLVGAIVAYFTTMKIANIRMPLKDFDEAKADLSNLELNDSDEDEEGVPRYKTSVVRVEPTELRIFA